MYYAFETTIGKLLHYFYDVKVNKTEKIPSCEHYNGDSDMISKICASCGTYNSIKEKTIRIANIKTSLRETFDIPFQILSENLEMDLLKYIVAHDGKINNYFNFDLCIASKTVKWIKPNMKASDSNYGRYDDGYSRWDGISHYDFESEFYVIIGNFNPKQVQEEFFNMDRKIKTFDNLMKLFYDADHYNQHREYLEIMMI